MNLVIVESPAKGRTIKKILGANFNVIASFGHIRDLPAKEIGIDIKNNFEPKYVIPVKARKTLKILKDEIAKSDELYLATDYDREGEAIAWHIIEASGLKNQKIHRITFHEITKPAVLLAMKNPRNIDMNLVNAQQGRRVLDRLVGYKLSPFLWQKVAQGLSAGRVQSVAMRLVVEREREVRKFVPEEYWQIIANLSKKNDSQVFIANLTEVDGQKIEKLAIKNEQIAKKIFDELNNSDYIVSDIKAQTKNRYPAPPFTTSTLQQAAAGKLHFSPKYTMRVAQKLYEDGLITYMRTDSVQVSNIALAQAQKYITQKYGSKYALEKPRFYKTRTKGAQEAHEAIRPTDLIRAEIIGESDAINLYNLIFKRIVASQMKEATFDETVVTILAKKPARPAGGYGFLANGSKVKFDGFLKVYQPEEENNDKLNQILPNLEINENLNLNSLEKKQKFTEPPIRFSEATLIRELEKRGIGRPSTYAPTLSTIIDRGYVQKETGKLVPKEIGEIVTDLLVKHFPDIIDYNFTAKMEEELDEIALGRRHWQKVISEFYEPFAKELSVKQKEVSKKGLTEEKTDKKCPDCGNNLVIRLGRYGKFLACSGFPKCKYTSPLLEDGPKVVSKEKCPECGKNLVAKEGKFGQFLACDGFPKCKFTKNLKIEAKIKCPNCGKSLLKKNTRKGKVFWGCTGYPECKTAFWDEPQEKLCPKCNSVITMNLQTKVLKCSKCEWKENG